MKFRMYKDTAREWRWQLRAANNKILPTLERATTTKRTVNMRLSLLVSAYGAPIEKEDDLAELMLRALGMRF